MPFGSSQWMYSSGFYPTEIDQSLKFDGTAYLSRTPSVAGNRKTWTWSGWVKRGNLNLTSPTYQQVFSAGTGGAAREVFFFDTDVDDTLSFFSTSGAVLIFRTNAVFRDASSWYHIVLQWDTTQATASDRVRLYVNGIQQSFSTANYPTLNSDTAYFNTAVAHYLGTHPVLTEYLDGYMADTYFVDGTALDPTSFGEFKNGVWIPKAYTGSYGTNGFHLTYQDDTVSEGFNTVTWNGNGGTQSISGLGLSPDLVWVRRRNIATNHNIFDSVRGTNKKLYSNLTNAEFTDTDALTSFDSDGFTVGADAEAGGASGSTYVGWCWDAGDSTVSNTDGSITSSVRANPAYGFSIVSYTGTGAAATVGHGLGAAPDMIIVKQRNAAQSWAVYHASNGAANVQYLDLTDAVASSTAWNSTTPASSVFSVGTSAATNGSSNTYIAYCFADIAGYSKFGSYTGNGSATGPTVTLGFKPAFVMYKRTDSTGNWGMLDNTRDTVNPNSLWMAANLSNAETLESTRQADFSDTGFQPTGTNADVNASGGTYIYMAFADTRDLAFWRDQSGNGNDWQPNNLNYQDTVFDSPTNNYATLNPLDNAGASLANGNLQVTSSGASWKTVRSTFAMPSGSWYAEFTSTVGIGNGNSFVGIAPMGVTLPLPVGEGSATSWGYSSNGNVYNNGSIINATGSAWSAGATVAIAFDGSTLKFYNANTLVATISSIPENTYAVGTSFYDNNAGTVNFGQSGFTYTPPDGFLALSTANLPEPSISPLYGASPQDHFNTVLYTGNSSTQTISTLNFQPDLLWIKVRNTAGSHDLFDSVRGANKVLYSNVTAAEETVTAGTGVTAFNSNGFTLGDNTAGVTYGETNFSGNTYVAWNWKASNATAVSNTEGTITSQVSANTTAGFSIVTYTGNGSSSATVGHGLGVVPAMVITKGRSGVTEWMVKHQSLPTGQNLILNQTLAASSSLSFSQGVIANLTSSTTFGFTSGSSGVDNANQSGITFVAYCFADVEGYSKFGSYTGNGSTDGTFVYTGFRPAYVMIKDTTVSGHSWVIWDGIRDVDNSVNQVLYANQSSVEDTAAGMSDFVSNGFKLRNSYSSVGNLSGSNYIYMAFAENPFKYANAR